MDYKVKYEQQLEVLIGTAVAMNLINRKRFQLDYNPAYSPYAYAREFCTVRLDIGRQTGKTTYIKESIRGTDDICIVQSKRRNNWQLYPNVFETNDILRNKNIFSRLRVMPRRIYVDDASFLRPIELETIWMDLADPRVEEQTFILLG